MEPRVEVIDVSLAYFMDRGRSGTFKEALIRLVKGQREREMLWALSNASLTVSKGEVFAVIGPNGAGKSTLMKVIARVLPPSRGQVIVRGMVAPIISLGAGFNMELTARENVVLYGSLLGRDPDFMRERLDGIMAWAEVAEFTDAPMRTFSSGMTARVAFSVATDVEPDVLVVDEVFAVGDQSFRKKSQARMEALIAGGTSVVLVTHNMALVRRLATRAMWLDHGQSKLVGPPDEVVSAYEASG